PAVSEQQTHDVYEQLGVRTIINASGATTTVGGTLMPDEVAQAMIQASKAFVMIDELNAAVGKKIVVASDAEAGTVIGGRTAGMSPRGPPRGCCWRSRPVSRGPIQSRSIACLIRTAWRTR